MILDLLNIDKEDSKPVYRQIADQLMDQIGSGILNAGMRLPGSRVMAEKLNLHRKTVVAAIEELQSQGWLHTIPGGGTYVAHSIPTQVVEKLQTKNPPSKKEELFPVPEVINRNIRLTTEHYHLDDGLPDPRLAPVQELGRAYKTALMQGNLYPKFAYGDTRGNRFLREQMAIYLAETRSMQVIPDQILITRGVTQALYLSIHTFLEKGDGVAVPELNWESANINFSYFGADLQYVKVDEEGLNVEDLERICASQKIKMLYLTPHHQYPTTVIMPAHRRLKLLQLAQKYGFMIFEDDYDYDFHYHSHPIMPLGSTQHGDRVLYAGSFTKAISPVFRVGYLVASKEQIDYMAKLRRLMDRQGDNLLELALAELLSMGVIQRYLRKNRKIYEQRRDFFCDLLHDELGKSINFEIPAGGMSVWTHFNSEIDLPKLVKNASKQELYLTDPVQKGNFSNSIRLGFASSNQQELSEAVTILKRLLK